MEATILELQQKETPLELFLNNLDSEGSRKIYQFELSKFFKSVGKEPEHINSIDILNFKASLSENKPSTKNRKLSIVKSYFSFLVRFKFIEENPADFIKLKSVTTKEPDILNENELQIFLDFPTIRSKAKSKDTYKDWLPKRDQAILALLGIEGLRVSEVCKLNIGNFNESERWLLIHGKVDKTVRMRISKLATSYVGEYLKVRPGVRTKNSPMFIKSGRGCTNSKAAQGDRITVAAIQYLVEQISSQLNFHKHVTPHTLRHTAATLMLEKNVNIKKVQKHLRHSSIQTTARYLHILDNKEAASEVILGGV